MGILNTAMNAVGTVSALTSLFGKKPAGGTANKLNNFISEIRANSVVRTNLFEVTITTPKVLSNSKIPQKISLYAEGAQLPGLFIQTADLKRYGIGPNEKVPYSIQTNNTTIKFIGDGKGEIYKFFYTWLQSIVRGDYDITGTQVSSNGLSAYEVEFKDQYRCTITITTFNEQGTPVFEYQLREAFPINVAEVDLNWSESSMMQFSVQFEYLQSVLVSASKDVQLTRGGLKGLSTLQKLVKIGTAVQALASIKRPRSIQDALSSVTTIQNIRRGF